MGPAVLSKPVDELLREVSGDVSEADVWLVGLRSLFRCRKARTFSRTCCRRAAARSASVPGSLGLPDGIAHCLVLKILCGVHGG